jgi:ribosomal peptide maturation radical SAM protein 1
MIPLVVRSAVEKFIPMRCSMKKVLLISMPMGALERQALGISLLKAKLAETGVDCDIRYLTFTFAEFVSYEDYQWMSFGLPYTAFAGDWSFTHALYGENVERDQRYLQEVLCETWQMDEAAIQRILRVRSYVLPFLNHCMAAIPWNEYAIVGFTSTFEQNIASLALAKRIKAAHPEISIIFGGANWEGEMGLELHRRFPFVDYACSGEAEQSFPVLVPHVLAGELLDLDANAPLGVIYRAGLESMYKGQAELIDDIDQLPYPDFSDYFRDLAQSTVGASILPTLLLETSRGCWWGAKSHCTFCGLNGGAMKFRSKSAHRVLTELDALIEQWQVEMVEVVDNILDMQYFRDFLPALAEAQHPIQMFYEVKANLNRKQVRLLHEAGVNRIQPGIESMSDHILKLMRKGTTALKNIQLLKWCREYNIIAEWNILYGFPGETREDYAKMLELLRSIRFLRPPTACGPIRLDRFSPYFEAPATFGMVNIRPLQTYKYLYPFEENSLHRIAYYFDFDYTSDVNPTGYARDVIHYVAAWQQDPEKGSLWCTDQPDGSLILHDTRSDATISQLILSGLEAAAYEFCDEHHSGASVAQHLRKLFPEVLFTEQNVIGFLESMVANCLMVTDGVHYLSLALKTTRVQTASESAARASTSPSTDVAQPTRDSILLELPTLSI